MLDGDSLVAVTCSAFADNDAAGRLRVINANIPQSKYLSRNPNIPQCRYPQISRNHQLLERPMVAGTAAGTAVAGTATVVRRYGPQNRSGRQEAPFKPEPLDQVRRHDIDARRDARINTRYLCMPTGMPHQDVLRSPLGVRVRASRRWLRRIDAGGPRSAERLKTGQRTFVGATPDR
jgi:hypothetical protein